MPTACCGNDSDEDEEVPAGGLATSLDSKVAAAPSAPAVPKFRVVFLNIDGVLNTRPDKRLAVIEGGPCLLLRRLLVESGARLVLSSPWRRHHAYLAQVLCNFGVFGEGLAEPPELERTPFYADASRRDLEILQWLRPRRAEVAGWVALDSVDLLRFGSAAHLEGHVVQVSGGAGFSGEHLAAALRALGCEGASSSTAKPAGNFRVTLAHTPAPWDVRDAVSWDDGLASKMEDVLGALAPGSKFRQPVATPVLVSGGSGGSRSSAGAIPGAPASGGGSASAQEVVSTADRWDDMMTKKMQDVLGTIAPSLPAAGAAPAPEQARSGAGAAVEFDEVLRAAKSQFRPPPRD